MGSLLTRMTRNSRARHLCESTRSSRGSHTTHGSWIDRARAGQSWRSRAERGRILLRYRNAPRRAPEVATALHAPLGSARTRPDSHRGPQAPAPPGARPAARRPQTVLQRVLADPRTWRPCKAIPAEYILCSHRLTPSRIRRTDRDLHDFPLRLRDIRPLRKDHVSGTIYADPRGSLTTAQFQGIGVL